MKKIIFCILLFMTVFFLAWNVYSQESAFDIADKNRDGVVTQEEYKSAVTAKFKEYDRNKDGYIDEKEFGVKDSPEAAKEFRFMDKNNDRMVSADEFHKASLQRRETFDFNRDSKISKEEYNSGKALPILKFYF